MKRKNLYLLKNTLGEWLVTKTKSGVRALFERADRDSHGNFTEGSWIQARCARKWDQKMIDSSKYYNTGMELTLIGTVERYMKEHFEDFL